MVTEYNILKYSHKMILDLKAIVVSVPLQVQILLKN
jgi:hypothetical protein